MVLDLKYTDVDLFGKKVGGVPYIDVFGNQQAGYVPIEKKVILGAGVVNFENPSTYSKVFSVTRPNIQESSSFFEKMFGKGTGSQTIKTIGKAVPSTTTVGKGINVGAIAIAGGAGLLGGWLFGGGGGKTEQKAAPQTTDQKPILVSEQRTYHAPYENYNPVTTNTSNITYAPSYQIISNSPYASITKKDSISGAANATVTPTFTAPQTYTQTPTQSLSAAQSQQQAAGTDLTKLAIIGAIALVGYGLVSGGKK